MKIDENLNAFLNSHLHGEKHKEFHLNIGFADKLRTVESFNLNVKERNNIDNEWTSITTLNHSNFRFLEKMDIFD